VGDSASQGDTSRGSASEQDADAVGAQTRNHIGSTATRRLIATAVGVDSPAVRALVERLLGDEGALDSILHSALSNPDRLDAVRGTGLLDSAPRSDIDRIAQLTAEALGTPYAAVSLVDDDRQVLVGFNIPDESVERSRPLEMSICKFAVVSGEPLIVSDAALHPLLAGHPMVRSGEVRAYAGIPLVDGRGHAIGTLCSWDHDRRYWTSGQIQILGDLAAVASTCVFAA
jgi:GAF domain-containing protein